MRFKHSNLFLVAATALVAASSAHADSSTWTSISGGNWTDIANWNSGVGPIADLSGFTASFTSDISATTTVSLNGVNRTIGNLIFSDNGAAGSAWTISGNTLTLAGGATPTITTTTDATISSIVAGNQGFTKLGAGMLTLSGVNTYTGVTAVNEGKLTIAPTVVVGTNGTVTQSSTSYSVANNATLRLDGSKVQGGSAFVIWDINPVSIAAGGTLELYTDNTIHNNVGSNAFLLYWVGTDQISGAGNLNKEGNGVIDINGVGTMNDFTGTLNVNGGTLALQGGSTSTVGNFAVNIASSGTLDLRTDAMKVGTLTGSGNILTSNGGGTSLSLGNDGGNGTFTGSISGGYPVIKAGTGTQELSGTAITYTGATTLTKGTLTLTKTTGFASTVGVSASNVATLQLNSPSSGDSWTFTRQINGGSTNAKIEKTGSGTVILTPAASSSFVGSATGALTVTGGKLYLNNSNFTTAPAVSVAGGATFGGTGTAGAIRVANGGTLQGGAGAAGTLTAGHVTLGTASSDLTTLKGILSTTGGYKAISVTNLTINGGNQTVTLDATGTGLTSGTYYDLLVSTNAITAPNATSVLDSLKSNARAYTPAVDGTGKKIQLYYDAAATITWTGANGTAWNTATTNWKLTGNSNPTQFLANDVVYFGDSPTNTTVDISSGDVSPLSVNFTNGTGTSYTLQGSNGIATGAINKPGAGLVTILNTNSFSGGTILSNGTLAFANGALGTGSVTFSGNSTLKWNTGNTQSVPIAVNSGITATLDTNGNSVSLGSTTGAGNITKDGAGTLTLGATAAHTGTTAANTGTLVIAGTVANSGTNVLYTQASSGYSVASGATLRFDASQTGGSYSLWNIKPVSISSGGTLELTDNGTIHTGPTTNALIIYNGSQFSGTGALSKEGAGALVINSTAALDGFTGTLNVNQGTLSLQGGATSAVGNFIVNVAAGGTLDFRTDAHKVGAINGSGTITKSYNAGFGGTITIGCDNRDGNFSGTISSSLNSQGPITKTGTGTQTFSGANIAYTGATTVSQGRLKLSDTTAFNSNVTVNSPATLELNQTTGDWSLGKTLDGSGAVEKTGAGTVALTTSNTYSGDTTVSAGTLLVNGSLGNTSVTVGATGTIGGTGTIAGSLNFDAGAILNIVDINDALAITGSVTFDAFGFANITGWDYMNATNGTYTLLAGSNFNLANVSNVGAGNALPINGVGRSAYFQNGSLQVVVIPEPATALLGCLGLLALLRRRRA